MFSRPSGVGCAGGGDDGVAGVVAGLLVHGQVADAVAPVSFRRAGRRADRIRHRFRLGDLLRARLVLPSRGRGSYPWRLASMSCPSRLILFAFYHWSSRLASRFSSRRASRCNRPAFDVFFLCIFHPVLRGHVLARFVPVPVSSVVSSSRLVVRLGRQSDRRVLA